MAVRGLDPFIYLEEEMRKRALIGLAAAGLLAAAVPAGGPSKTPPAAQQVILARRIRVKATAPKMTM